jgi:hypothetical protein
MALLSGRAAGLTLSYTGADTLRARFGEARWTAASNFS